MSPCPHSARGHEFYGVLYVGWLRVMSRCKWCAARRLG